ncbi:proto-oncogene tyrosine-protein kinase receptor Ret-like [Physella acuta]|uniref:proto-oncogene tyrosine-protein kinase receptor Ret-like n=1 Tax=Physella acuta TaxID=109671 RepID=UPI0027DB565C|nr:proto-oncogene tyrosine-protein kinase receptor Ret-like [Physella acuta]
MSGRSRSLVEIAALVSLLALSVRAGLYIPKRNYNFYIPSSPPSDGVVVAVNTIDSYVIGCDVRHTFPVVDPDAGDVIATLADRSVHLRIHSGTFQLTEKRNYTLKLLCKHAVDTLEYYRPLTQTQIWLLPSRDQPTLGGWNTSDNALDDLCPQDDDLAYDVIENSGTGAILDTLANHWLPVAPVGVGITLEAAPHANLSLTRNNEVILLKSLDREVDDKLSVNVTCHVDTGSDVHHVQRVLRVKVYDVNDCPVTSMGSTTIDISVATKYYKTLMDADTEVVNLKSYSVSTSDTAGVVVPLNITTKALKIAKKTLQTSIKLEYSIIHQSVPSPYTADIILENLHYDIDGALVKKKVTYKVIYTTDSKLEDRFLTDSTKMELYKSAGKYSLILDLAQNTSKINKDVNYTIKISRPQQLQSVLAVNQLGQVYVSDTRYLISYNGTEALIASVLKYEKEKLVNKTDIHLKITEINDAQECDQGCSLHKSRDECTSSCGFGAVTGRCVWREANRTTMTPDYETCSPSLDTCPDGICSPLEELEFFYCPQDCLKDNVGGQASKNPGGRGIAMGKGVCSCDLDRECVCEVPIGWNRTSPAGRVGRQQVSENPLPPTSDEVCSQNCRTGIAVSVSCLLVITILAAVVWAVWRRREGRSSMSLKHVNSLVSMAAVPSDYIVDDSRDQRPHPNRPSSSPASGPNKLGLAQEIYEDKWEFPRSYLTLEHAIGEGEFGQVVRAQAMMLNGQEGKTVVAVKMLKPDASGAEYQDLVSELQLLKEVEHPNIIKLLGVCTQKGPLYVIVEYCELGSLRSFLRSSKLKNKGRSWEDKERCGNESNLADTRDSRILTMRDLLSFAWQIAKGMDYLAGLKIVHRDLAARNVLVTEGMKLKISDFGLSRDVYEADTYLKMSKGRMPVKWMAPESLYAQIYTMKSDIWSYGIVLWEIVTLGASPYPGIPPERIFPLLSTGYRMDRPEDCPEELYAIMQKCWKTEPENRPHFSVLRDILDHLLQQNMEYLELSNGNYFSSITSYDFDERPCDVIHHYNNTSTTSSTKQCPPDAYVTTSWPSEELGDSECPELSKLLVHPEKEETDEELVTQLSMGYHDGHKKPGRVLVHENFTYV